MSAVGDVSVTEELTSEDAGCVTLRLRADASAIDRLLRMPPLAFLQASAPVSHVGIVGFDTPRGVLRKAGFSLIVERRDGQCSQVLYGRGRAWNEAPNVIRRDQAAGLEPLNGALRRVPHVPAKASNKALSPLFTLVLAERTMVLAAGEGGEVRVTIASGSLEAGKHATRISELALDPAPETPESELWQLALALHRLEPLVVAPRTIVDDAGARAHGKPPAWSKAGSVAIDPEATLDDGIAAILGQCFGHWMGNQAAAHDGRDIEGVHQMRVAMRRLRAAFVFLAPWLEGEQAGWLDREVKWMARKLGAVRDLDVLLADTLAPVASARGEDRDLKLLVRVIRQAQTQAHDALVAALATPRYTTLVLSLGGWIAGHDWRAGKTCDWNEPLGPATRSALEDVYQQVLDAGGDFVSLDAVQRHDLRLDFKRLRYALQFVGGAFGDSATPWMRPLGALQDGLGAANDAALAEEHISALLAARDRSAKQQRRLSRASGLVVGWWLAQAGGREKALRGLWSEFTSLQPFWRGERPPLQIVANGGDAA